MPGPSNASNRFGPSSYIVGTPANGLGNGVNFTSIQAAIDQAIADGYGVGNPVDIVIRAGVYNEDVTITNGGISLVGVSDAPNNLLGQQTFINGTISLVITGINQFALSNMFVRGLIGPALSVTGGVIPCRMSADNCTFSSVAAAAPGVSFTNTSGTLGLATFTGCSLTSGLAEAHFSSARTLSAFVTSNIQGATDGIRLDGSARVQVFQSVIRGLNGFGIIHLNAANQSVVRFSVVTASDSALDMTVGGSGNFKEVIVDSGAPSGFFIQGIGNFEYCDITNEGSAIALDPAIGVITVSDWKPYAEAGVSPGTGVVKGTACFDSTQFTVVDGFVQSTISGAFPWVQQAASVTVNPNEGNFSVATITLTLPMQPQLIGTTCKFKVVTNDVLTIAGNAGDVLQLGNQSGTSLTSTSSGDAIEFTHYDLGIWLANASIGNWVVNP